MPSKPGELKAQWSKRTDDMVFSWGGAGADKSDGHWLHGWLCYHKGFDDVFVKELVSRGYDITTLKISIKRKK